MEDINTWDATTFATIQQSDVLVVMTGEEEKESGEARSKTNPLFSQASLAFIRQLKSFGKPIVLIITAGRPLVLTDVVDEVDAILYAYFLGSEAASTIVDTLYGRNNPSAKLTMSFPRHLGQIPISYNHLNTGRPFLGQSFTYTSHYIDESNLPLFTFGDGLSYTTFQFSELKDASKLEPLQLEVTVKNTGTYAGYVIIPVYLENPIAPVALANRQLVGMSKVKLEPGASQVVTVEIDAQFLTYIDRDYQRQPLKGKLTFTTGQAGQWLSLTKEIK